MMQSQPMPMSYPPVDSPVILPDDPSLAGSGPPSYSDPSFLPATPSDTYAEEQDIGFSGGSDAGGLSDDGGFDMSGDEASSAIDGAQPFESYEMSLADQDLGIPGLAVGSAPGSVVQSEAGDSIQDDSEALDDGGFDMSGDEASSAIDGAQSFEGYEMSLADQDLGIPGLAVGSAPGSAVQSEAGDSIQDDNEDLDDGGFDMSGDEAGIF
jgi:hypothetical protein